jgi:type I restriction enzyme S subunit
VKCIEDEIPFEVPEGWEWCRFGSVVTLMSGTTYPAEKELLSGTRLYVKVGNMNLPGNEYEISTSSRYLDEYNISHLIPVNSVIFPKRGGAIATNKKKLVLRDEILIDLNTMAFTPISPVNLMYCYYWFLSIDLGKINSGSSVPQINNKDIEPLLFPVPPTFEQERIVQAIVPLLDAEQKISAAGVEVTQIISRAKARILDLAIRGQLVPQNPDDEPASVLLERIRAEKEELIKQGKIKRDKKESIIFRGDDNSYYEKIGDEIRCIDEELPFEIPDRWEWVRLENCCCKEIRRGKSPKYIEQSETLVFAQKCNTKYNGIDIGLAFYLDESTLNKYPEDEYMRDGDIVINSTGTGTLGRVGFYRATDNHNSIPIVPDSHVTVIRSTCSSLSKLKFISSSIIGSLNRMDFSHCPLGWRSS